ncbi:dockerin type I domain-containing protein, partial [bacterium]
RHNECDALKTGAPGNCSSGETLNDPVGDTCDKDENIASGLDIDDVLGISAGAGRGYMSLPGDDVVCANINLGGNPPDVGSSSGPIDQYMLFLVNPDIPDENPYDVWKKNLFIVTYAPEAAGVDPNLVKVLWDGNCVTNPNTADPLACKLIVGGSEVRELKIGAANGEMKIIVKNALPNGKTIFGATSKSTHMSFWTMQIDLSGTGCEPWWTVDSTTSLNLVKNNGETTICTACAPGPPIVASPASCVNGAGTHSGTCPQSGAQPANNGCELSIYPTSDCAVTDEYKIYYAATDDPASATELTTISTLRDCAEKSYSDTITTLDGKTHYYWVSGVNDNGGSPLETGQGDWSATSCTVEDWVMPDSPASLACATPDGNEKKCECTWTADTVADPSIAGFNVRRDTTDLTGVTPYPAAAGATEYSYTDSDDDLVLGQTYTYGVSTNDTGGNESAETTATCTPEDLVSPDRVDSLTVLANCWELTYDFSWQAGPETDLAGYNAYKCHNSIPNSSCILPEQFTKINTGMIPHVDGATLEISDSDYQPSDFEEEYCYWVEACDNCDTEGNCPTTGVPNCSTFNTMRTYLKCVFVSCDPPDIAPLYPDPGGDMDPVYHIKITAPPEGGTCELEWNKVCEDESGPFTDCNFPEPDRIVGYYIMRAESLGSDCTGVTVDTDPVNDSMGHLIGTELHGPGTPSYSDTSLTNGTTYCYRVHGYNAFNHYSREDPPPDPVPCTPSDNTPPDPPVIDLDDLDSSDLVCTIAWHAVSDQDTVTYNLYRCAGDIDTCASEDDFTTSVLSDSEELQVVDVTDDMVEYTYCVTATDPSSNESAKVTGGAAASPNCVECLAVTPPEPPTDVNASTTGNGGYTVYWTASAGEDGSGSYNIYTCDTASVRPGRDSGCIMEATSIGEGIVNAGNPYEVTISSVTAEGDYYVVVTYTASTSGAESGGAATAATIYITGLYRDRCEENPVPADCNVTISFTGVFGKRGIIACNAGDPGCLSEEYMHGVTGIENVSVDVLSATNLSTIKTVMTAADGSAPDIVLSSTYDIVPGSRYIVRARYPASEVDDPQTARCTNADTFETDGWCAVEMLQPILAANFSLDVTTATLPMDLSSGGGGSVMGDPNGDGVINMFDIAVLKGAFGAEPGDLCYKAWADLNLDGKVNLFDLGVIKNMIGPPIALEGDPDYDPIITQDKDPYSGDSECCGTLTCD